MADKKITDLPVVVQANISPGTDVIPIVTASDGITKKATLSAAILSVISTIITGVSSVNTRTGAVTLTSTDVSLGNVDNTSDANKPVSTAQAIALALKAGLTGNTFTGDQVVSDNLVTRAMLKDCGLTSVDKGNSSTTLQTLDYTAGSGQKITATGNFTIASSNWPPTGNLGHILLELVNGGAFTVTWPTISWVKPDGTTTTSIATYLAANTGRTALQTSGTDQVLLWSKDAGTTIYGKLV